MNEPESEAPSNGGCEAEMATAALKRIARDEAVKGYVQGNSPIRRVLLGAARRFIGGERLADCLDVAKEINRAGHAVTIDYMGESTRDAAMANEATEEFIRVSQGIAHRGLNASVSLDLSHVGLAVDRDLAFENAAVLAEETRAAGLEMMISMEGSERTGEIFYVYRQLSKRFSNVGITLQAHLRRTPDDLRDALDLPGKIRLVKGAFEETEEVAMFRGPDLDAAYGSFVEELIVDGHPTSISTHDPVLLDHAHQLAETNDPTSGSVEFEMLHGVQTDRLGGMRISATKREFIYLTARSGTCTSVTGLPNTHPISTAL